MNLISGAGPLLWPIVVVFAGAAILTLALTPVVRRFVVHHEIVDLPDERRVNTVPMPRAGGLAIAASFLLTSSAFLLLNQALQIVPVPIPANELAALLAGGAAAAALGALDDFFDLKARWQLVGQIGLAVFAIAAGIVIDFINDPFGPGVIFFVGPFAAGFTIFWIVGMINSINFIDGLDGLSSGIALIAAVTLGLISLSVQVRQPLVAVLCFALAGSLLGFLRWNLYPAIIFSGTSGVPIRRLHPGRAVDPRDREGRGRAAGPRRTDHRHVLDHRPPAIARAVAIQSGPPPHPPSAPRHGAVPPTDGLRHLRPLPVARHPLPGPVRA